MVGRLVLPTWLRSCLTFGLCRSRLIPRYYYFWLMISSRDKPAPTAAIGKSLSSNRLAEFPEKHEKDNGAAKQLRDNDFQG